jgi:dihydroxy-acid dehydratase
VVESQEQAVSVILARELQPGDVLVVRYEGPAGGPGMQEMLHPQGRPAGQGVRAGDRRQVLRRFVRRGCRAHLPGSRRGGVIGLVEDGDLIVIDVQERALRLMVDDDVLAERRAKMDASERPWQPVDRQRPVAKSLRAYARMATSAATGAVRDPHR